MTPNRRTDDRPLCTNGSKNSFSLLLPYRDTPGILAIGWIALSSSLKIIVYKIRTFSRRFSSYTINIGYIKLCGRISTFDSCHFLRVGWKIALCSLVNCMMPVVSYDWENLSKKPTKIGITTIVSKELFLTIKCTMTSTKIKWKEKVIYNYLKHKISLTITHQ